MFKFDQVALPQLLLRKALIIVDFQQDFVGTAAALPITLPEGYVDKTIRLAKNFRTDGDVIWVNSKFQEVRPPYDEHIAGSASELLDGQGLTADPEAFLSHERAKCMLSSKLGAEVPQSVKEDAEKNDVLMWKSHYSAFESTGLLRLLRARMTMEVYICGSLINVGVFSTTIDAAGHGLKITLVHDCCGYSSEKKRAKAVAVLRDLTDCDISSSTEIIQKNGKPPLNSISSAKSKTLGSSTCPDDDLELPMHALTLNATPPRAAERGTMQEEPKDEADDSKYKVNSSRSNEPDENATDTSTSHIATMNTATNEQGDATSTEQDDNDTHDLCEGDTCVIENMLPPDLENGIFEKLNKEVQWQRMSHQGGEVPRLVAVQGEVGIDGSMPIYRHPSDESPPLLAFSPSVLAIKAETEKQLGHPLNHVLIQFYRDGKDYISEHSDKTLDIVRGSYIANVSLGAKRIMVLRTKRSDKDPSAVEQSSSSSRKVQRAALPHNSLCRMGLNTNMKWLHSIRQDKRADREKSPDELAYEGGRISLTFRHIGTFLDKDETIIWGQGATSKTRDDANSIVNGQTDESIKMLRAFGTENHSSNFDWDTYYGRGFDVLHLRSAPRFFASTDPITNVRVCIMLAEYEIGYASGSITQAKKPTSQYAEEELESTEDILVKFVDNDDEKTEVSGDIAIMLYLYFNHQKKKSLITPGQLARQFTLFQKAFTLSKQWREASKSSEAVAMAKVHLASWEICADGTAYIGGDRPDLADFAFWPALHNIVKACGKELLGDLPRLSSYYETMKTRASTVKVLDRLQQTQ